MAVLLSLVALLLVIGICAVAMRWLSRRVHRHSRIDSEIENLLSPGRCFDCDGVGATRSLGELQPCKTCDGTGISKASF